MSMVVAKDETLVHRRDFPRIELTTLPSIDDEPLIGGLGDLIWTASWSSRNTRIEDLSPLEHRTAHPF